MKIAAETARPMPRQSAPRARRNKGEWLAEPLSPRHRLRRLDKRTREAQFLRKTEAELFSHLGGIEAATVTQRILVQRLAADLLRLRLYDDRIVRGEDISDHDGRIIGALRNAVRLALRDLGLEAKPAAAPTLAEIMDEIAAERADA